MENLVLVEPISLRAVLALIPVSLLSLSLPGLALSALFFRLEEMAWSVRLPVAVGLSIAVSILLATFVLGANLGLIWLFLLLLVFDVGAIVAVVIRRRQGPAIWSEVKQFFVKKPAATRNPWLWGAFILVTLYAFGRFVLPLNRFTTTFDFWSYLAFVRKWATFGERAPLDVKQGIPTTSFRYLFGGWLLVQALLSALSGVDPIDVSAWWLPPILMIASYLGFYALAGVLFRNRHAAILSTLVQVLSLGVRPDPWDWDSFGLVFFHRIAQDKFLLTFLLLPVATILALRYLRSRRRGDLAGFLLMAVSLPLIHPLGLVEAGLTLGPFALLHLALDRRCKTVRRLAWIILPLLLLLAVPLTQKSGEAQPYAVNTPEGMKRYEELHRSHLLIVDAARNRYVLQPKTLASPVTLAAIALAPLLLLYLRRNLAAQFLLAGETTLLLLLYNPLLTPLLGRIMTPWLLWRLPYLLPSSLIIGYLLEKGMSAIGYLVRKRYGREPVAIGIAPLAILGLAAAALQWSGMLRWPELPHEQKPQLVMERDLLLQARRYVREPSVVMCDMPMQYLLPAFLEFGYVPTWSWLDSPIQREVTAFYASDALTERAWKILQTYDCRYVIADKEEDGHLLLPSDLLTPLYANARYALFRVEQAAPDHPLLQGNSYAAQGNWEQAMVAYARARPEHTPAAYLRLAEIQEKQGLVGEAEETLLELLSLYPNSRWIHLRLAELYRAQGQMEKAWEHYHRLWALEATDPFFPSGALRGLEQVVEQGPAHWTTVPDAEHRRWGASVNAANGDLSAYDVGALRIGWFMDWRIREESSPVPAVEHVQLVRVRADLYSPQWEKLGRALAQRPGAIWLIGMWPEWEAGDNRTPEAYAEIYHEVYTFLKERDAAALVVPGGIMQPTELRLRWLDVVREAYQARYRERLPADAWHISNYILREERGSWGAGIPVGLATGAGRLYKIEDNVNIEIFREQIVAFRRWMQERGERGKPLILSGLGVQMPSEYLGEGDATVGDMLAVDFMRQTFDYLRSARDEKLGYPADDNRLVQRWLWHSLNDTPYDPETGKGHNGVLCVGDEWTVFGQAFLAYMASLGPSSP